MKLSIISGSHRKDSYSLKASTYLQNLAQMEGFNDINIVDLSTYGIPLWNEGVRNNQQEWDVWKSLSADMKLADAAILVTPEWHGMATPALKNFLMLCTADELGHKPVLICSVSASINGVYPISELRMSGSKNNHACFIPDHLIFRNCESLILSEGKVSDAQFDHRAKYTVRSLSAYANALASVRKSLHKQMQDFPFGM
ncbi:NADPH-dependent oxidoreductase [Vibrio sp. OCN044]|uniref:NADPH-dependent oxidoreductase n=1 Tax=Vibrio tetraodonis subsp. pristinus TaxID=2695891 RepID=A0A6L8LZG8_9VIBR|nr:NAD(P)H-dependent oxidoreductase [Vibrio tetraodonis]MYM61467.1 NADPH-dependent oxidoreductase [Vibrio tetraodonis subsp. pristinus]